MIAVNYLIDRILLLWWKLLALVGAPTAVIRAPLPQELADLTPESAGLPYYEIAIDTKLGGMPAWVVPSIRDGVQSSKWIVFIHGRGGARVGVLDMLPVMQSMGFNSLVITHRNDYGAPASLDHLDHLGAEEWRDLDAAVEWIVDNHELTYLVMFARSAGAQVVGQFLNWSHWGPWVDRMILDNPVLDWDAVFMNARPKWLPYPLAKLIIWANGRRIGAKIRHFNWVEWPPADRPPVLILHSVDDEVCPIRVSRSFARTHPDVWPNIVLAEFPTGGHAGARFEAPVRYLRLVRTWLVPEDTEKRMVNPSTNGRQVTA